jgi:hypothetical protein
MESAIRSSGAHENSMFRLAVEAPEAVDLRIIVREWYPVTQSFCLGLLTYNALFAREVSRSKRERRRALEEALLAPLEIGSGEFGMGKFGGEGIHYRMFARLGEPLGIELDELQATPYGTLPETRALVDGIETSFSDLYRGAACIRVVEGTAYSIVEAMDRFFSRATKENGKPLFSEYQTEYISLHLEIEKGHDCLATDFTKLLCETEEQEGQLRGGIRKMCSLFGGYWEALASAASNVGVLRHAEAIHS